MAILGLLVAVLGRLFYGHLDVNEVLEWKLPGWHKMITMPSFVWQWNVLIASKSREMRINLMFLELRLVWHDLWQSWTPMKPLTVRQNLRYWNWLCHCHRLVSCQPCDHGYVLSWCLHILRKPCCFPGHGKFLADLLYGASAWESKCISCFATWSCRILPADSLVENGWCLWNSGISRLFWVYSFWFFESFWMVFIGMLIYLYRDSLM